MKPYTSVIIIALCTSMYLSQAFAGATCLNPNEQREQSVLREKLKLSKELNPACINSWGAAGCLSPLSAKVLAYYDQLEKECALIPGIKKSLEGQWDIVARVCEPSGNPAKDGLKLGRDTMSILIRPSDPPHIYIFTSIEGHKETQVGQLEVSSNQLYISVSGDRGIFTKREKVGMAMTPYPTLILSSRGFDRGGSCAVGETLDSYFRKR